MSVIFINRPDPCQPDNSLNKVLCIVIEIGNQLSEVHTHTNTIYMRAHIKFRIPSTVVNDVLFNVGCLFFILMISRLLRLFVFGAFWHYPLSLILPCILVGRYVLVNMSPNCTEFQ